MFLALQKLLALLITTVKNHDYTTCVRFFVNFQSLQNLHYFGWIHINFNLIMLEGIVQLKLLKHGCWLSIWIYNFFCSGSVEILWKHTKWIWGEYGAQIIKLLLQKVDTAGSRCVRLEGICRTGSKSMIGTFELSVLKCLVLQTTPISSEAAWFGLR